MRMKAGRKISLRCNDMRLKVKDVAKNASVTVQTVNRWRGRYDGISLGPARKIAEQLEVSLDWLFDDKQDYPPPASAERPKPDPRFANLEKAAGDLTQQQIVEAILEYRLKQARAGTPTPDRPGGATEQSQYDQAKAQRPGGRAGDATGTAGQRKAEAG